MQQHPSTETEQTQYADTRHDDYADQDAPNRPAGGTDTSSPQAYRPNSEGRSRPAVILSPLKTKEDTPQ